MVKRKVKQSKQQVRLDIKSNAGGTGKSTLAVHLAYSIGQEGYKVVVLELDPQGSLRQFVNLPEATLEQSICTPLLNGVKGTGWLTTPIWTDYVDNVSIIQGGPPLASRLKEVENHRAGNYLLANRLQEQAIDADLIIFDNNASNELLGLLSLACATHCLVPLQCEPKAARGLADLIRWFYGGIQDLRLEPEPEILGVVPFGVNDRVGIHRQIETQLPDIFQRFEYPIHCFPKIRYSNEFPNASAFGLPLHIHRPRNPAIDDFIPLKKAVLNLLEGKPPIP